MTTGALVWKNGAWVDAETTTAAQLAAPGFNVPAGDGTHFWVAADGTIKAPNNTTFVPVGANMSGTNFVWDEGVVGHSAKMATWHWNTIRLNCMIRAWEGFPCLNPAATAAAALPYLTSIVNEYTALGHVVMITNHTYGATTTANVLADGGLGDLGTWWTTIAAAFAGNPRVWFNPINEPTNAPQFHALPDRGLNEWAQIAEFLGDAITAVAPNSMLVFDGVNSGQEKGHPSCRNDPDFNFKPFGWTAALNRYSNLQTRYGRNRVIFSSHFYNVWAGNGPGYETFYPGCVGPVGDTLKYFREDAHWYLDQATAKGVPVLFGEFGGRENDAEEWFMLGGTDAAHMLVEQVLPNRTTPKPGALFWHASGQDLRYLETTQQFWHHWDGNTANLGRQGLAFYNYCVAVNP